MKEMKPIPGFSGYYASSDGLIYSDRTGELKPLSLRRNKSGYLQVNLTSKAITFSVHVLVLMAFSGTKAQGQQARIGPSKSL